MRLALLVFLVLASTIVVRGQNYIPIELQAKRTYNPSAPTSFGLFAVDRSPTDSLIISLYNFSSSQPGITPDISLNETPEFYAFESGRTAFFRIHDPIDLSALHTLSLNNPQVLSNSFVFRYSGGVIGCEMQLPEASDTVLVNGSYTITNQDPERKLSCFLFMDAAGNLLHERHIYYTENPPPISYRSYFGLNQIRVAGSMNENLHLFDFNFEDSIEVITGTENFTLYHPEKGIYLHAIHNNGTEYSGELIHDGHAYLTASQAINDGVIRMFGVRSGTAIDLDPTEEEFMYAVDEGVFELILVKYNISGHIEWVKPLSQVESPFENPGDYIGKLITNETGQVAAAFYFSGNEGTIVGSSFFVNGEAGYTDYNTVEDYDYANFSPVYVHTLDAESGSSSALYSVRNITSTGFFPSHNAHIVRIRSFDEDRFSLRTPFTNGFAADFQYIRHFPDSTVLETAAAYDQTYQAHYMILPYSGNQSDIDQYTLDYDVTPPYNSLTELGICKTETGEVLFGGDLYGYYDFSFYPDQLVNINADYFNGIGLLLRTQGVFTNTDEPLPKETLRIFPNPASDEITIVRPQYDHATFEIYDSTGRMMINGNMNNQRKTIQVQDLPNGVYFLRVGSSGEPGSVAKFIKTD